MSEFLAEAQVLIRPDTTAFRAQLLAQLSALKVPPITVPVVAAGAGLAAAAAATAGLAVAQKLTQQTTADLTTLTRIATTSWAKQAVILQTTTAATAQLAGAQSILAKTGVGSTASLLGAGSASARLDAALLGLRTAVGSTAVIGLGALALAAIVAGKALRGMVIITAQFEQELNTFKAVAAATADEMQAVSDAALRLGADVRLPAVSAADAAVAMTELAKAGLSVQDAIDGAEGVLQLATAAQITNAEASQIAANALNAFGLAGEDALRVADNLANAANAAQGSISDFGLAFQQSAAVARQVGLSLEDTTALLSLLAKNGLRGSDAGTSLRVSLIKLIAPTDKARGVIDQLGISIRDAQGNVRPDVFAQFAEATAPLGPKLRDVAAATVFGTDGLRALAIAGREGAEGLRLMQFQIDQQGTAAEVAAARTKGLSGEARGLSSNMQTLGISIGSVTNPILTGFAAGLSQTVGGINRLAGAIGDAGKEVEKSAGPDSGFGKFIQGVSAGVADLTQQTGILKVRDRFREVTTGIGGDSLSTAQKVRALNTEMKALQTARIGAEAGGLSDLANQFTGDIERIREQIAAFQKDTTKIGPAVAEPLRKAAAALRETIAQQSVLGRDTTRFAAALRTVNLAIGDYTRAAKLGLTATNSVASGFEQIDRNARSAAFSVGALTAQVANLTRESSALGDQLLKLQSEGGTPGQQIAVLQQDIATQRALIVEAQAGPAEGRATAIRAAREKIISDQNEIKSLLSEIESAQNKIVSDAKAAATKAEKAQQEREEAFQRILDAQLRPIQRLQTRALGTKGLGDDIKFREALIARYRAQIAQIKKVLGDTKFARTAIKAVQDLILLEINKLRTDRQNFQQALKDKAKAEKQKILDKQANIIERAQLNVEFAQTIENVDREIRARRALIAQYKKAQAAAKGNINEVLRYRNLIAEETAAIKELQGEKKDQGVTLDQLAFDFFQKQQGFAANLLGNLIPGSATGGLVGGSQAAPLPTPASGLQAQAAFKTASPTYGQAATEVDILKQVLQVLRDIQRGRAHPEAAYQRAAGSAALDVM